MSSIGNYNTSSIRNTHDEGMWVDEDLSDFVDCFSFDVAMNPSGVAHDSDLFGDGGDALNWDDSNDLHSRNKRRFSLLGYDNSEQVTSKKIALHAQYGYEPNQPNQQEVPSRKPELYSPKSEDIEIESTSEEFRRKFKHGLSKLEKSMKRTEESRKMLSQQGPAFANTKGQLFSYISQLRNSTM